MRAILRVNKETIRKALKGEGTRGGKIIGHTKSGKPVYGVGSPHKYELTMGQHNNGLHWGQIKHPDGDISGTTAKTANEVHGWFIDRGHDVKNVKMDKALTDERDPSLYAAQDVAQWMHKKAMKNAFISLEDVAKAMSGEGTRGGKIIGHTKSGKAIYQTGHSAYSQKGPGLHSEGVKAHVNARKKIFRQHYPGWTKNDHDDAEQAHRKEGQKLDKEAQKHGMKGTTEGREKHREFSKKASEHHYAANQHGMYGYGGKKPKNPSNKPI